MTKMSGAGSEASAWILDFCNAYASQALWLAKLFLYLGLVMGVVMAAAEAYKLYREAKAIQSATDVAAVNALAGGPAAGEIVKALVGLLTGAKAWLALVIVGVVLWWLAGSGLPEYCTRAQPVQSPQQQQAEEQQRSEATAPTAAR